jgi:arsenite/tail-anchored protein-transporting ATPase
VWAQQVEAQQELERNWSAVQSWLGGVLAERGVERIAAEELTVPPGGDELFSLLRLKRHAESGDWDAIVVDCAPTGETLRLLSFPDAARWWLDRVLGREHALLAAARPLARAFLDLSLPDDAVVDDVQRLVRNLIAMHELLRDTRRVTLRLVMTPDRMVVAESMRTFTYLNLYGYLCDAVIVNRVFGEDVGAYFGAWREVLGDAMLDRLGDALFGSGDASAVLHDRRAQELELNGSRAELRLDLPFVSKGDVALKKIGLELVVRVDGHKRTIVLPGALAGFTPTSAKLADGSLVVGFEA